MTGRRKKAETHIFSSSNSKAKQDQPPRLKPHKDMKSTMRYIHLERTIYQVSDKDEWVVKAAKTVDDASELISVGFEYVTKIEGFKLFRKHK